MSERKITSGSSVVGEVVAAGAPAAGPGRPNDRHRYCAAYWASMTW